MTANASPGGLAWARSGQGNQPMHLKIMVSGPPKSGKTTLLRTIPNLLVCDTEPFANNLESIAADNVPSVTIGSSSDLKQVAMILGNQSLRTQLAQNQYGIPDIQGVAIDTLDTFQKILKVERMKEQKQSQFLRDDWGWLKTEMEEIVQAFTALPMHVVFIVHTKTKEMGKGDDAYTIVLPGLEGAISESIAGMVGYSLLSFRREEVDPAGAPITKYFLRTEGDATHDFLGTRTAGRLPAIIEPDMKAIYDAVIAGRATAAAAAAAAAPPAVQPPVVQGTVVPNGVADPGQPVPPSAEVSAQTQGQPDPAAAEVQTAVQTPAEAPAPAAAAAPAEQPVAEKPADDDPVNAAALGHVKRVYDAMGIEFPEDKIRAINLGQARTLVRMWVAIQEDAQSGQAQEGSTPVGLMSEYLGGQNLLPDAPAAAPAAEKPPVEASPTGTIAAIKEYIGNPPDLAKVQEVYNLEHAKGGDARVTVLKKMEDLGATPILPSSSTAPAAPAAAAPTPEPTPEPAAAPAAPEVQTPVETTPEAAADPVTPEAAPADVPPTEEERATGVIEAGLGAVEVVEEGINANAPCAVCGGKLDDLDLAELGLRRFQKLLCVADYLKQTA